MKTELMDSIQFGKLVELIKENEKSQNDQYDRELYQYFDKLHNRIRTLELALEVINDQSKKFI